MGPIGFDKKRADRVMKEQGVDAMVLFYPVNIFYTSGMPILANDVLPFWGIVSMLSDFPAISIIPRGSDQILVGLTSAARDVRIHSWVADFRTYSSRDHAFEVLRKALVEKGVSRGTIAIDEMTPTFAYESLRKHLPAITVKLTADDILNKVKIIKTEEEIRRLKKAGEIGQKAIMAAIDNIREGIQITELVQTVKSTIIKEGGTGWNHTNVWCEKPVEEDKAWFSKLRKGDIIHIDIGAVYHGYSSDLRRTAIIGEVPKEVEKIYGLILETSEKCMNAMKPGVKLSHIYHLAHDDFRKAGYGGTFSSSIGHSIGVKDVEAPMISPDSLETFKPNMAFCMEMWYIIKRCPMFGVGVEDTGIITEKGFERFTTIDRDIYTK